VTLFCHAYVLHDKDTLEINMEFTRKALRDELVYRAVPLVPLRLRRQLLFHHSHGVFF